MNSSDLADNLLALAREDLEAARSLKEGGRVGERTIGFHAQQAVEKAIKAVLAARGIEFPFSHDIALLGELCREHSVELPGALDEVDRLSPYAATLRYGLGDPSSVASDEAIRWASAAIAWAEAQRPSGQRPE